MRELTVENLAPYLHQRGVIARDSVDVEELFGGVSNRVYLVRPSDGQALVVKQARPQLRTAAPWFCTVERIWREMDVLRACHDLAPPGTIPEILFEDRDNYVFGMTAAPPEAQTWKHVLLAGQFDPQRAQACGAVLGQIHAGSWRSAALRAKFADQALFEALRIDPYYRSVARHCSSAAPQFEALIAELAAHPLALVHADFSPKNLLVWRDGLLLVDFETGHYGDPAFDLGFFLAHLMLKACRAAPDHRAVLQLATEFLREYRAQLEPGIVLEFAPLLERGWRQLGGCLWARIDGTSQVEYLPQPDRRDVARTLARELISGKQAEWEEIVQRADALFRRLGTTTATTSTGRTT